MASKPEKLRGLKPQQSVTSFCCTGSIPKMLGRGGFSQSTPQGLCWSLSVFVA
jgi:hypothetical protein